MHKPCITVGNYACDPGPTLFNLLLSKKVDLILSGHEHSYQRSHQLRWARAAPTLVPGTFDADCVADSDDTTPRAMAAWRPSSAPADWPATTSTAPIPRRATSPSTVGR